MKKTIKRLWVKALKSNKYKQTKGRLRNCSGDFCCLGVLCDLHRKTMRKGESEWRENIDGEYEYKGETKLLPDVVATWAGLDMPDRDTTCRDNYLVAAVRLPVSEVYLTAKNDNGSSFVEIANFIEAEL